MVQAMQYLISSVFCLILNFHIVILNIRLLDSFSVNSCHANPFVDFYSVADGGVYEVDLLLNVVVVGVISSLFFNLILL